VDKEWIIGIAIMLAVSAVAVLFPEVLIGHSLAIREDRTLWAWGSNWDGQLGDGTTIDRHEPVHVLTDVKLVD